MSKANGNGKSAVEAVIADSNGTGKDAKGKFTAGNQFGTRSKAPMHAVAYRLRVAVLNAVKPQDMENATQEVVDIACGLNDDAKPSDQLAAFKMLYDVIGGVKIDISAFEGEDDEDSTVRKHVRRLMQIPGVAAAIEAETVR